MTPNAIMSCDVVPLTSGETFESKAGRGKRRNAARGQIALW